MQSINNVKYKFGRGTPTNPMTLNENARPPVPATDAGTLFNFGVNTNTNNRPTNSVSVENIPQHVNRCEILALFSDIRSYQDIREESSSRLDITFTDRNAATKALCMNGYSIAGAQLSVSALTICPPVNHAIAKHGADDRRNLYVLGLPFALSKNEFATLFSQYGVVSHCVILATVDNSSRRRGFVVMSSHEEAKHAMTALTRTSIKGHSIDVSWAVVQRSQGFLDGGDRAMLLDSRSRMPSPTPAPLERQRLATSDSSDSSDSRDANPASLATTFVPTMSLLVTNLPTMLFSQVQDLHPLFLPFGQIEKLEIVQVSAVGTMSVFVQYASVAIAQEAKECLGGQVYGNCQIDARFVRSNTSAASDENTPLAGGPFSIADSSSYVHPGLPGPGTGLDNRALFYNTASPKPSPLFDYLSPTTMDVPRYGSLSNIHTRHSSLSAKPSSYSNVFDDANSFQLRTGGSSYGYSTDRQRQYVFSKPMHSNTFY
ncbi:hypothetical protein D9619_008068 [Psilocybe cf. subviscida]|uniref:RRM domain-containing protein n=1 Tax=Psilocybe cf. subviscida TaxID=2480587 RepID=A0A8H5AVB0_9AGAR|nr:hypothetical protein D9619_008068 [Psilocybe cf. subviscida]